jgi:hypothetical protein
LDLSHQLFEILAHGFGLGFMQIHSPGPFYKLSKAIDCPGHFGAGQVDYHKEIAIKRISYPLIEQNYFHIVRIILINK